MSLSVDHVTKLIAHRGQAGINGLTAAATRFNKNDMNGTTLTINQKRFVQEVGQVPRSKKQTYNHPAATASVRRQPTGAEDRGPLTPAEVAWLQQLPTDPSKVSYGDAEQLAELAATIPVSQRGDRRLVNAVWTPVREFHDANEAEAMRANANQPLPPVPATALPAMADAVASENDQLQPEEALTRASKIIRDLTDRQRAQRDTDAQTASDRLASLKAAAEQRLAPTR